MKELSIEEKAKAYDEAIKRAKAMIPVAANQEEIYNSVITIFPELKESEDEKIRQLLLRFVKYDMSDNYSDDFTPADCVAWLEKQGEQEQPTKYTLEQAARIFLDALSDTPYNNKPVTDAQVITRELLKFLSDARSYNPDALNEQKPWSEEDERIINGLIDSLTRISFNTRTDSTSPNYTFYKEIDWLKSLKDRVQPQKKWTPNEEQIEALVSAIDVMIDNRGAGDKNTILLSGLYHELKTL